MDRINQIINSGLCLGCGFCEAITSSPKCKMTLNEKTGFYVPLFKEEITHTEKETILSCCPAINVTGNYESTVWGKYKRIEEAWAADDEIRKKASSGGVISALAVFLIEQKKVDAILQVGVVENSYLYNELKVSRSRADVLKNVASRYAPALLFDKLKTLLDNSDESYAFIGKPCDIAGIKNFIKSYHEYKSRFKYFIALFCAGMPSYNGTKEALKLAGHNEEPYSLKYRGDGWPGFFEAKYKNHSSLKISYNDSWGKILGKHLGLRCKICPDGIGLLADISVGDSWNTDDGYPNFEEAEGKSFVMVRTPKGEDLFNEAFRNACISIDHMSVKRIKNIQPYQYQRRLLVGFRILPVQLYYFYLIRFKRLGIVKLMLKCNLKTGFKNLIGTTKRLVVK